MPRINGVWEKTQDSQHLERWEHTETGDKVKLADTSENTNIDYRVILPNGKEKTFGRKSDARDFATNWMKGRN